MINIEAINIIIIMLSCYNIIIEKNETRNKRSSIVFYAITLVVVSVFNILNFLLGYGSEAFIIIRHLIYGILSIVLYVVLLINLNLNFDKFRKCFLILYCLIYGVVLALLSVFDIWQTFDLNLSNRLIDPIAFFTLLPILVIIISVIKNRKVYERFVALMIYLCIPIVALIIDYIFPNFFIYTFSFTLILFFLSTYNHTHAVSIDKLTNVLNRLALEKFVKSSNFRLNNGIVYFFDLDEFKYVNDTYGHKVGDILLKDFSSILVSSVLKSDKIFRYGGDEFLVISNMPENKDLMLNTIKNNLKIYNNTHKINLRYSCGYNLINSKEDLNNTIEMADKKMYEQKFQHKKQLLRKINTKH